MTATALRHPGRLVGVVLLLASCSGDESDPAPVAGKSSPSERAGRRAYEGAPPVIPHAEFGASCVECHNDETIEVPDLGIAPPDPHVNTPHVGATRRCRQCHVSQPADRVWVASSFEGAPQVMRRGDRQHAFAPPTIPHPLTMREDCHACHDGPAARAPIRTPHPERARCRQCHVPDRTPFWAGPPRQLGRGPS